MEPWKPADSLVWGKLMALNLCHNMNEELQFLQLLRDAKLSYDRVMELFPPFDFTRFPTVLQQEDFPKNFTEGIVDAAAEKPDEAALDWYSELADKNESFPSIARTLNKGLFADHGKYGASNNFVVGGSRTSSGKPFLANDPHLTLTAPSIWLAVHLNMKGSHEVWGASFPGLPGIVIGRNNYISWAVTNTGADVQDLYVMKGNDTHYLWDGEYVAYELDTEIVKIKGQPSPRHVTVRRSLAGVVVSDNDVVSGDDLTLALSWVSLDSTRPDTTVAALLRGNKAKDFSEFRSSLELYAAPAQNFIFADTEGNIGYQMPGWIPRRQKGHTGRVPMPGDGRYSWKSTYVEYKNLPTSLNPKRDFIASANNRVTPPQGFAAEGYVLSNSWDDSLMGYRARRITQMIENMPPNIGMAEMKAIQLDYHSGLYDDFLYLLKLIHGHKKLSPMAKKWAEAMISSSFGGDMDIGSEAATVFAVWYHHLSTLVSKATHGVVKSQLNVNWLLKVMASDTSTDPACGGKPCFLFAVQALEDTVKELFPCTKSTCVGDETPPKWGQDVHFANFEHEVLGKTPLSCVVDRSTPHGGDDSTVNVGHFDAASSSYAQTAGPSYRHIIDLADMESSEFLNPLGQSGDPFSLHFDDLLNAWSNGDYMAMGNRRKDKWPNASITMERVVKPK